MSTATVLATPALWATLLTPTSPESIRDAVTRSISAMQQSQVVYVEKRSCFGCHHQLHPLVGLSLARSRGFEVDEDLFQEQLEHTVEHLRRERKRFEDGRGPGGQVLTAGSALRMLRLGGYAPDEVTEPVVAYLLKRDRDRGYWRQISQRPPSGSSHFTSTRLAIESLQAFATPEQRDEADARIAAARRWLIDTAPKETEEHVSRLWGLKLADAPNDIIRDAVKTLIDAQHSDGGWAQKPDMDSDAYATGTVLVVLHQMGGISVEEPVYRRGVEYLVRTQKPDGTWHVRTRAQPIQQYFESGFPYGKDQFISISATGFATAALALTLPEKID